MLGDIIEHASAMSYPAFLRARIFAPLAKTRTGISQEGPAGPGHARGYLASGTVPPATLTAWSTAAGAAYSATGDLERRDQALITGTPRPVPPPLLAQILTVHAPCPYQPCPLPADRGYGYGWFAGGTGPAKLVSHSGPVPGFWACNGFYPARDTIVVILSNPDTVHINTTSARLNQLATGPRPPPRARGTTGSKTITGQPQPARRPFPCQAPGESTSGLEPGPRSAR